MNIYESRQDVLDELEQNLQVEYKPYGTWKIKSYIGNRFNKEHYVEVYYYSHNEEDSIGIFDGEKYYPQDFEAWKQDYAHYEIEDYEHYHDEELRELFNDWCEKLWSDSGNENNYEPIEDRYKRLAENLLEQLEDSWTNFIGKNETIAYQGEDNLIICNNGNIVVLTEEENKFLEESGTHYLKLILNGQFSDYIKAFNEWADNED